MLERLKEVVIAIGFLVVIVGICFLFNITPFDSELFFNFIFCAILVVIGQLVFLQGASTSLINIGKHTGSALMKIGKIWLILIFGLILGFVCTIAEPDVQVLADLISPYGDVFLKMLFVVVVGLGVGFLTLIAYVRILKNIPVKYIATGIYAIILILALFAKQDMFLLAFDSAGVTTGAVTVPFILALTIGICNVRMVNRKEDNFGVAGIATSGSIISVLIMSYFLPQQSIFLTVDINNFWQVLVGNLVEVSVALMPIIIIFLVMQFVYFKFPVKYVFKIIRGYFFTAIGLILFLTGVLYGFAPIGEYLGANTASTVMIYILSLSLGFVLVFTEPSIKVLLSQIDEVSNGLIKKKYVYTALALAVAGALVLATIRMYFDFSYWYYIVPLLITAITLMYFSPTIFYSIAFDSGGIVAGTILTSFVLPFYIGLSRSVHGTGNNALGMIGLVTLTPVIAIEILGMVYSWHEKNKHKKSLPTEVRVEKNEVEPENTKKLVSKTDITEKNEKNLERGESL